MLCVRLEVELNSDSVIAEEDIGKAMRFGVDQSNVGNPIDTKKFVLAFIQKLLLQREKIDLGLLTDYLESEVITIWQNILSTLENSQRKFVDVHSGSLIFTLFCPTLGSKQELSDDSWIKSLTLKIKNLVKKIGEYHVQIHRMR